jgi:sugar phosphate isomerase/epimerase
VRPVSLSTSWNAGSYDDARKMLFEIKDLGFSTVELSFNLLNSMVEDIAEAVNDGDIRVSSVHNYCPIPLGMDRARGLPDCYAISSSDNEERALAVKFSKLSIDNALRLKAAAVVMHCGRVEMPDATRELIRVKAGGQARSAEFIRLRDQFRLERERISGKYLSNTLLSLEELAGYAAKKKIKLGIENRFYYREIPTFEETAQIFENLKDAGLCFWYDTGHGRIMEELGFVGERDFLRRYSALTGGLHLHTVRKCKDHFPPSPEGDVDFRAVLSGLHGNVINVIEAHKPATAEELIQSRIYIESLLNA